MKKKYIAPEMLSLGCEAILLVGSIIENGEQATVTPDETEYNGEFSRGQNVWDEGNDGFGW